MAIFSHFLFVPGTWQGSGTISFSMSPDVLRFTTSWTISQVSESVFQAVQVVDIIDSHTMKNVFTIGYTVGSSDFTVILDNDVIGSHQGKGIYDDTKITWEFRHPGLLEGIETYEKVLEQGNENALYRFHSEYNGGDGFMTVIQGNLYSIEK